LFASIGIENGKTFAPDARMKKILTEAAAVGNATVRTLAYKSRIKDAYLYPKSAWCLPWVGGSYQFEQNSVRLLDAQSWYFFYAFVDSEGNPLDGSKTYKLQLPPNIPVKDFWSVIIYDNQTRSQLQTDQRFPSVSSQTKGLAINDDRSVDVYFGPKAPTGKENNWVQTIPGKGWNVLLRLYGPLEPWFDKTWRPGEIELVPWLAKRGVGTRTGPDRIPGTCSGTPGFGQSLLRSYCSSIRVVSPLSLLPWPVQMANQTVITVGIYLRSPRCMQMFGRVVMPGLWPRGP
jgi:hypothetical protein